METRFYQARGLNIERIALDLERIFLTQSYQVQHFGNQNQMTIQFKKGGDFAAILGMQAALTLTLQSFPEGITAVIGQQKWADKAAAGAVGMLVLWPLAFTAGAGAIRQSNLSEQVLNTLDTMVRQQSAQVQIGPAPLQMLPPQVQQQLPSSYAPPASPPPYPSYSSSPSQRSETPPPPPPPGVMPPSAGVECSHCHTRNAAGDIYCARCGKPLASPSRAITCPQCGALAKPDALFCTKCGTSFAPQHQQAIEPTVLANVTPGTQQLPSAASASTTWGYLLFASGKQVELDGARITIGRTLPTAAEARPDINLYDEPQASTVSRLHAVIEQTGENSQTLTDLNSTNFTKLDGQKLIPNFPVLLKDGSLCEFGQVKCTFKRKEAL